MLPSHLNDNAPRSTLPNVRLLHESFVTSPRHDINEMNYDEDIKCDVVSSENSGTSTPAKFDDGARSVASVKEEVHYRVYKRRWAGLVGFVSSTSCCLLSTHSYHVARLSSTSYLRCRGRGLGQFPRMVRNQTRQSSV